ncbi:hypothetical protein [Zooshikella ganghwensis]|uniref:hypothetical protein n=1 Tax=Zooshikella ganghwensis TaxID=202772 RepID=UPI00041E788A|nr:hypothetical protein [Zooshikella ganghwensis]
MSRKSFTAAFKSKVAIEALKGHKTTNEIASELGVHTKQNSSYNTVDDAKKNIPAQYSNVNIEWKPGTA